MRLTEGRWIDREARKETDEKYECSVSRQLTPAFLTVDIALHVHRYKDGIKAFPEACPGAFRTLKIKYLSRHFFFYALVYEFIARCEFILNG